MPVLARVHEGFSLHFNRGEVDNTFEAPLAFLMAPQNHRREKADWNGLTTGVYAIVLLRNLWERIYKD